MTDDNGSKRKKKLAGHRNFQKNARISFWKLSEPVLVTNERVILLASHTLPLEGGKNGQSKVKKSVLSFLISLNMLRPRRNWNI